MSRRFRKKPMLIEAFQFIWPCSPTALPEWWQAALAKPSDVVGNARMHQAMHGDPAHCLIFTREGVMRADLGDWVIRGVQGELYPCKPDIFAATYEEVTSYSLEKTA